MICKLPHEQQVFILRGTMLFGAENLCCAWIQGTLFLPLLLELVLFACYSLRVMPSSWSWRLPFFLLLYVRPWGHAALGLSFPLVLSGHRIQVIMFSSCQDTAKTRVSIHESLCMDAWEQPVSQVWGLLALCNTQPLSTEAGGDKGLKLFKYWVQCFEILLSKL